MSQESDTIELISSNPPHLLSISDTDTLCILIDNGKIVDSSGQAMSNINMVNYESSKQQMESLWSMLISLPLLASDLEKMQDNIEDNCEKVSRIYKKLHTKLEKSTTKHLRDYTRIITPLAAFSNNNRKKNQRISQNNK